MSGKSGRFEGRLKGHLRDLQTFSLEYLAVISIIIKSLVCVTLNTGVIILNKVSLLARVFGFLQKGRKIDTDSG